MQPFNGDLLRSPFDLPEASEVRLVVYDVLGREVAKVLDRTFEAGRHRATWRAAAIPSGVHLYRLEAGDYVETKRMVVVK